MIELYTALFIIGMNRSVDMILHSFTGNGLDEYWDMMEGATWRNATKPVIFCVYCMPSVWATASYLYHFGTYGIIQWAMFVFVVAALIHIINRVIEKLDK
jgi:hypothetical protein